MDMIDAIFTATSTMLVSAVLKSDSSIADVTTTSKRMLFNLSGVSTSTTRNLTVQDADGTLAYTAQIAASTAAAWHGNDGRNRGIWLAAGAPPACRRHRLEQYIQSPYRL